MKIAVHAALAVAVASLLACSGATEASSTPDDAGGPAPDASLAADVGAGVDASNPPPPDAAPDAAPDALTCPSAPRTDPGAAQRAACAFHAGDLASTTLGLSGAARGQLPIRHIVVMMKENRSFDHMLGALKKLQPEADVADSSFVNLDAKGVPVTPFHLPNTCVASDPEHQWDAMHAGVNGGKMDGFVTRAASSTGTDGHFVMGYFDEKDLPFYYFLASTYSIADRYFASVRSGTFPNRDYLLLATSDKVSATQSVIWPDPTLPTIFDELSSAGIRWGVYADDFPLEGTLNDPAHDWEKLNPWSPIQKLYDDFAHDTVPGVVFVDGTAYSDDEHPVADVQQGEAWTKRIYDAAVASKAWSSTVLLLTYDEGGGFADHAPPSNAACVARPADAPFFELGVRVPLIAISPWARRHHVSHVEKQHTSITRFIEAVYGLPAMTARDANSDALLDMFDFDCAPAPVPAAPPAGTGSCGGTSSGSVTLDKATFASGETILVHFAGGPANPKDWIAVYPRATAPHSGATLWNYCATNTHTATTSAVSSGTVTLGAGSAGTTGAWPLAAGSSWTAYYLVNDGYTSIGSVDFDIAP